MWEIFDFIARQENISPSHLITICLSPGQREGIETSIHFFCLFYISFANPKISKKYLKLLLNPWPLGVPDILGLNDDPNDSVSRWRHALER